MKQRSTIPNSGYRPAQDHISERLRSSAYEFTLKNHRRPSASLTTIPTAAASNSPAQRASLVALFNATCGPQWSNHTGWLSSDSECAWHGVECFPDGTLQTLDLGGLGLLGPMPSASELAGLSTLTVLVLDNNPSLLGDFDSVSAMPNLLKLSTRGSTFTGDLSAICSCIHLEQLQIGGTPLKQPLPDCFGTLTHMQALILISCGLTGLPSSLAKLIDLNTLALVDNAIPTLPIGMFRNMTQLQELGLDYSGMAFDLADVRYLQSLVVLSALTTPLYGRFDSIAELTELNWVDLQDTHIAGAIPTFQNTPNIQHISASSPFLNGGIPDFSSCTQLQFLWINLSPLTGSLPEYLCHLPNLQVANFGYTDLSGPMLDCWTEESHVKWLLVPYTNISGPIPPSVGRLTSLEILHFQGTNMAGPLPPEWASFTTLTEVQLSNLPLNQSIPAWFGKNTNLGQLIMNSCGLVGELPPELGGLQKLQLLSAVYNPFLTGSIPSSYGDLLQLQIMLFHGCSLTGSLPRSLANLTSLLALELDGNQLTGWSPADLPPAITSLNLNGNPMRTNFPPELCAYSSLISLQLTTMGLMGRLPDCISSMTQLAQLYLSSNSFSGPIPPSFGSLSKLIELDLSDNQLSGVPT